MAGRTIGYKDVRSLLLSARESFARCLALSFPLRRHGRLMSALSFWSYLHSFVVFASIWSDSDKRSSTCCFRSFFPRMSMKAHEGDCASLVPSGRMS